MNILSNSTTKKVYVRRFDRELLEGYVSPQTFLRADGIEVINREAEVVLVPYEQTWAVYFVRDFRGDPETDQRKVFASRPKLGGLWVQMQFRNGEVIEGVMPNNLLQIGRHGVTVTPPDANANTQKVFVPRSALDGLQVLGVVGSPIHRRRSRPKNPDRDQMGLFRTPAKTVS